MSDFEKACLSGDAEVVRQILELNHHAILIVLFGGLPKVV